ncbi:DUF4259 domain-containing protein [Paenibacillus contaminans]|uniref:DUF4259 domain-containing protein n=1 Tax=Paenibacillus contaminans TaxID=450362 RepID=A0A329MRA6_9BACL|nr:DUF4259 domain-containing protein [Paenibacillus contaminans]RAV22314.1 hypothetical protein DQG23_05030 [Paenibacillus contaminans]
MGAWGIKAMESDEGLDLLGVIKELLPCETVDLSELMAKLRADDFLYDETVLGLAELYLEFQENGGWDYDYEEEERSLKQVRAFTADRAALEALLQHLKDIWNDIEEGSGERDLVELWQESSSWDEWRAHVQQLMEKLDARLVQER